MMSTEEVVKTGKRIDGGENFFQRFSAAWNNVTHDVLKLETRQTYQQSGDLSWELFLAGDVDGALELIPQMRQIDVSLYKSLALRGVHFVRCRPVNFPLTQYLQLEMECYEFNEAHGENIRFINGAVFTKLFDSTALHDFMVFDSTVAFVHDYDSAGLIQGGWEITLPESIKALRDLYLDILKESQPFKKFML